MFSPFVYKITVSCIIKQTFAIRFRYLLMNAVALLILHSHSDRISDFSNFSKFFLTAFLFQLLACIICDTDLLKISLSCFPADAYFPLFASTLVQQRSREKFLQNICIHHSAFCHTICTILAHANTVSKPAAINLVNSIFFCID